MATDVKSELKELAGKVKASAFTTNVAGIPQRTSPINQRGGKRAPPPTRPKPAVAQKPAVCPKKAPSATKRHSLTRQISGPKPPLPVRPPSVKKRTNRDETNESEAVRKISSTASEDASPGTKQSENAITEVVNGDKCKDIEEKGFPSLSRTMSGPAVSFAKHILEKPRSSSVHSDNDKDEVNKGQHSPRPLPRPKTLKVASRSPEIPRSGPATPDDSRPTPPPRKKKSGELKRLKEGSQENSAEEQSDDSSNKSDNEQLTENNDLGYVNVNRTTSVSTKAPRENLSKPKLEEDVAMKSEAYDKSIDEVSEREDARMEVPVREERAESQDSIASYENIPDIINKASPEDENKVENEFSEIAIENDRQVSTPRKVVPYENVPIMQKPEQPHKVTTPETAKRQISHPYENIPSPLKAKPSSKGSVEPALLAIGQGLVDFSEHKANGFKENHEIKAMSHVNETVSKANEALSDDEPDYENTGEHARFNDPSAEMLSDPDSKFNVGFSMDFNRLRIDADDIIDPNDIYTAVPPRGSQMNQISNDFVSSLSPTRQVDLIQESYYQSPSASPKPQTRRNLFGAEASGQAGSAEHAQKRVRRPAPQPPVLDSNFNVLRSKNKPSSTPPKIAKAPIIQGQPTNLDDNIYVVPKTDAVEVDSVNSFHSSVADDFDDHIYKAPTLHPECVPEDDRKGSACSASSDFECFDPTQFNRIVEQEYSVPREANAALSGDEYMEPSRLPSFSQKVQPGLAKNRSESSVSATGNVELKPRAEYVQMVDPVTGSAIGKDGGGDQNDSDDDYEKIGNQSGQIDQRLRADPVDEQPEYVDMSPVKETRPQSNVYLQPLKPPSPSHTMIGGVRPPPLPGVSRGRKIPPARPAPPAPDRIRSKTEVRPMLPPVKTLPSIPPVPVILDNSKSDSLEGHYERIQSLRREMGLPPTAEDSSSGSECYDSEFDDDEELTGGPEKKRDSKEVDDIKPRSKLYNIANEILTTERTFVNALRLVCDEFAASVKQMTEKDPMLLPKGAYSQMFDDIKLIYDMDKKFLQELEDRMKEWDTHNRIGDIVKKYGYFLKMYTNYIKGYDRAMAVFQECVQKIPKFASLTKEYEKKPMFMNLKVSFFMLKPIQRIPSYRLLLIDYRKHLPEESEDYQDISNGLEIVSKVATHINESMKEGDKFQTMLKLQDRIINSKEIVKPGRFLLKEGVLSKLSRKDKQERMFFLLTDCLLYCEHAPVSNQYKLRQELPLAGMSLDFRDNIDFIKELTIISTKRSFTVVASSQEERDEWVKAIQKAMDDVSRRMGTFQRNARPISSGPSSPKADLGKTAPSWVPDARATMCSICCERFTRINRKHHCRACGEVVCKDCSSYEAPLPYLDYDAVRVCEHCYDHLYEVMRLEENALDETDSAEHHHPLSKVNRSKSSITSRFQNHSKKGKTRRRTTVPDIFVEVKAQEGEVSGYLKLIRKKKLKKRWFVLKGNVLYSFKAPSDPAANSTLPVLGYKVNVTGNFDAEDYSFQLEHIGQEPLVYKANSREAVELWVNALEKASQLP